jgi:hypothetical protein
VLAGKVVQLNEDKDPSPVPYDLVWQPSLNAKLHQEVVRIGICTPQAVTFITYFMEISALLVILIVTLQWFIKKKNKE